MIEMVYRYVGRSEDRTPVCEKFRDMLKNTRSMKGVFDIALRTESIEFICESVKEGWSPTKEEIWSTFKPYLNGNYVHDGKYTSVMYCGFKGKVICDKTVMCLLWSDAEIVVPKNRLCMIYVAGEGSKVKVTGEGRALVYCYEGADAGNATEGGKTLFK